MVQYIGNKNDNTKSGSSGPDQMDGRGGNDKLKGLGGNDLLIGGSGDDILKGGSGDDILDGGSGNDKLYGDGGNDLIFGMRGNDKMWGGSGDDTFAFPESKFGKDVIKDFVAGAGTPDQIAFHTSVFLDFAAVMAATSNVKGNAVIKLNANNKIKIEGVKKGDLHADDFDFLFF